MTWIHEPPECSAELVNDSPLWFGVQRSALVCAGLLVLHIGAPFGLLVAGAPPSIGAAVAVVAAVSAVLTVCEHGLRLTPGAVVDVRIESNGTVSLTRRDGERRTVTLGPRSSAGTWHAVLELRAEEGAPTRLFLLQPMVGADTLRRLRVFLRTRTLPEDARH